jgi:hypothetical protein
VEGLSVPTNGMAKQWYKLHVSSCHGSWIILKGRFCFAFFRLSKIMDLRNGAAWSRYNQLALLGPELSILDAMFMQHFVHGLGIESTGYLDMTYGGVFVHCMVEEGRLIWDRILLVTLLEDLQIKALLISEDEPIITHLVTLDISAITPLVIQ